MSLFKTTCFIYFPNDDDDCVTWNKIWKLWKTNHDNVKFCNKNVNVVENNYILSTKVSYNEDEARVLLANRVGYHDNTYILTCER